MAGSVYETSVSSLLSKFFEVHKSAPEKVVLVAAATMLFFSSFSLFLGVATAYYLQRQYPGLLKQFDWARSDGKLDNKDASIAAIGAFSSFINFLPVGGGMVVSFFPYFASLHLGIKLIPILEDIIKDARNLLKI